MAVSKKALSKKPLRKGAAIEKSDPKAPKHSTSKSINQSRRKKSRHDAEKSSELIVNEIKVRMYCHGFGDCFLVTFCNNNEAIFRILIDCGMLTGNSGLLLQAIEDIKKECKNKIDVVVQTHEHKDHISGFNLKGKDKKLIWDSIDVDNVWLAWTENTGPDGDDLAIELKEKFRKKKNALARALGLYNRQINSDSHKNMLKTELNGDQYISAEERFASSLDQLLSFYDISAEEIQQSLNSGDVELGLTMKDAMQYFIKRSKVRNPQISYWNPGDFANIKSTGLPGINFYFLGPPKDYAHLRKMDDKEHIEMYFSGLGLSDNFYHALSDNNCVENGATSPFLSKYCLKKESIDSKDLEDKDYVWNLYFNAEHKCKSIETDWLQNAGTLALNLDSYTNNTSLVIAIEFEHCGKVLLFPADAQIGNWLSWTENKEGSEIPNLTWKAKTGKTITAADLLRRTVFYKVGHHASHNATAKEHGLELMTSDELAAMIPVDEVVAGNQGANGWKMPAEDLYKRLKECTKGRIIRLDEGNLLKSKNSSALLNTSKKQIEEFNRNVTESKTIIETGDGRKRPLYWEYTIKG